MQLNLPGVDFLCASKLYFCNLLCFSLLLIIIYMLYVCLFVFLCFFLPCVIATLTLCNRLIMCRLQIILFHCNENGCLVFLAQWLFQTASPINNYSLVIVLFLFFFFTISTIKLLLLLLFGTALKLERERKLRRHLFTSCFKVMLHETIRNNDFQRNIVAFFLSCCRRLLCC